MSLMLNTKSLTKMRRKTNRTAGKVGFFLRLERSYVLLKQWACVVLMFVLYPITAYSQASLYRLPAAETSLGLNLSKQNLGIITPRDTTTIGGQS